MIFQTMMRIMAGLIPNPNCETQKKKKNTSVKQKFNKILLQ
jgi:hypothetical protein